MRGIFDQNYLATIGADFALKKINVGLESEDIPQEVVFQIWDIAGQKAFDTVRNLYYRGGHGALLVFDVTNRNSALNLFKWAEGFWKNNSFGPTPIILLCNKVDLRDQVSGSMNTKECITSTNHLKKHIEEKYGSSMNVKYIETSAATGDGINEGFEYLAREIYYFFRDKAR